MHHPTPTSSEPGFLPAMYSFSGPTSLPEFDLGSPSTSGHLQRATLSNNWETRCLRKHRRRVDDEGCSAKRRRLMVEAELDISENSNTRHDWPAANSRPPLPAQQASPAAPQPCPPSQPSTSPQPSSAPPRPETESSCMEIEAAQRKLQEIEDRITLEDDDEDEDLDVEPAPRRPVLVISDSLKEGLQCGISDILPHTVAQSVSHSCMELVLWRPPDDPFCRKRKNSLQKPRKQPTVSRQPPTPCPSPTPHSPLSPPSPPADTPSSLQLSFGAQLWRGGHGNVTVLDDWESHAKVKDLKCSRTRDSKGLRTTLSWSVWQGTPALHEYCAVLDSLCNTSFALPSPSLDFWTIIPYNYM